ncbi:DUF222 domain-containing protein, partial [Georgenia yuyongxinii]
MLDDEDVDAVVGPAGAAGVVSRSWPSALEVAMMMAFFQAVPSVPPVRVARQEPGWQWFPLVAGTPVTFELDLVVPETTPTAATGTGPVVVASVAEAVAAGWVAPVPEPTAGLAGIVDGAQELLGADLLAVLDPVEPFGQDLSDLVELAAQWSRVIGYAHARRADAVAALVTGFEDDLGTGTARLAATTELAMRLGVTRHSAAKVVSTALAISGPLAATGQALATGHLDARKAEMIATALEHQPYPVCEAVQDAVLPTAAGRTHPQLAQDLTTALIAADHHGAQARHRTARGGRRVNHPRHLPDGMASIFAVLPAPDALALDLALDAAARSAKAGGDGRTLDQ